MPKPTICVYGQFDNYWSSGSVSCGLVRGLVANGYSVEARNTRYAASGPHITKIVVGMPQLIGGEPFEAPADVGIFYGYPPIGAMLFEGGPSVVESESSLGRHKAKVGYLICESEIVPPAWLHSLKAYDKIFVPSKFVQKALGTGDVFHHGVDECYLKEDDTNWNDMNHSSCVNFLHINGARDFLDRKGFFDLVLAFKEVALRWENVYLYVRVPWSPHVARFIDEVNGCCEEKRIIHSISTNPLPPKDMLDFYTSGFNALVQPSRAEAFGLCCVEARMLGMPVLMTACTGHVDILERLRGDTRIHPILHEDSFEYEEIQVQGIPNGRAPIVGKRNVMKAMIRFLEHRASGVSARHCKTQWERPDKDIRAQFSWATRVREDLAPYLDTIS